MTRRSRNVLIWRRADWSDDQLRAQARASVKNSAPETFQALRKALGKARHPAQYLVIPPQMFDVVVKHLEKSGCAKGARLLVEKPFGRDLASARKLDRILLKTFAEPEIFRIDHYLRKRLKLSLIHISEPTRPY